jgi:glucarate dehydratase
MTAREALRRLEPFNVRSVEDPVGGVEDMVRLRPHTSISFSSHDPNLIHAVRLGAPDAIVVNLAVLGGLRRTVAFVNAAEHFGIDHATFQVEPESHRDHEHDTEHP